MKATKIKNVKVVVPKLFTQLIHMKQHIKRIHEGKQDYKCEHCCKSFSQAVHLKSHVRIIHEGHKAYKCEFCGKLFTQLVNMKGHIKRIHGESENSKTSK